MDGIPGFRPVEPALVTDSAGPPVLLMAGLVSSSSIWSGVVPVLSARYRLISCDLQDLPPGRRSVADRAQCWRDLMDYLELSSAHLVAHGSGCQVAAVLALESPYRALSLTLINPVILRNDSRPDFQHTWHLNMLAQWLETRHGTAVRRPEHLQMLEQALSQQTLARFIEPEPAFALSYGAPPIDDFDVTGLSDLDFPVLAVNGGDESDELCELTRSLYARAPHFQHRQIPGVRHNCLREEPALLAQLLDDFLTNAEDPVTLR